ncbi:hypothetical protein LCGC14_2963090 [marine sediment metagenome]|uniref:Uncharacterized protein n=1 Tax=marine sediment metagenome TaxID=412755 RepID=A0A0F8ZJF0_9ZZZZ
MKRIAVFDITSSSKNDDFNSVLTDVVNLWANENDKFYEIKDVSVFGFDLLPCTNKCHAKVLIMYEIKQDK